MKNKESKYPNYTDPIMVLGFWRHFAFVRFIYEEYLFYRSEFLRVHQELLETSKLTEDIKPSNNIVTNFSEEKEEEEFLKRQKDETIEDWIDRISVLKGEIPKQKNRIIRGASEIIEDARKTHIRISESAIDRIGEQLNSQESK